MKTVLIAGGNGLIGRAIQQLFSAKGYVVRVLSRNPISSNEFLWNPKRRSIDENALTNVSILINLCGEGIAEKRWTSKRKKELLSSRIDTTNFLYSISKKLPDLKHYISASGITCYGFKDKSKLYTEKDPFGDDYISQLVKDWEIAADQFSSICIVTKMRTAVVLSKKGGALPKIIKPIQLGFGSALGTGKQIMPWIHIDDLANLFLFVTEKSINGSINCLSQNSTNEELTFEIAHQLQKKIRVPKVPAFILKIILGEMAIILLDGVNVSNEKIKNLGFHFQFENLDKTIKNLVK